MLNQELSWCAGLLDPAEPGSPAPVTLSVSRDVYPVKPRDWPNPVFEPAFDSSPEGLRHVLENDHIIALSGFREYRDGGSGHSTANNGWMEYVYVDLDNKSLNPEICDEMVVSLFQDRLKCCYAHRSKSWSEQCPKYHVFFRLDTPTEDQDYVSCIYAVLREILQTIAKLSLKKDGDVDPAPMRPGSVAYPAGKNAMVCFSPSNTVDLHSLLCLLHEHHASGNHQARYTEFVKSNWRIFGKFHANQLIPHFDKCGRLKESGCELSSLNNTISEDNLQPSMKPSVKTLEKHILQRLPKETSSMGCRLLEDFENGDYLGYTDCYHLASAYYTRVRSGGRKRYFEILDNNAAVYARHSDKPAPVSARKAAYRSAEKYEHAQGCRDKCPHHESLGGTCRKKFILEDLHRSQGYFKIQEKGAETPPGTVVYENVGEARAALPKIFSDYFETKSEERPDILIVQIPPGTGKTRAMMWSVSEADEPLVMAWRTHDLINEKIAEYAALAEKPNFRRPYRTLPRPALPDPWESRLKRYESLGIWDHHKDIWAAFCKSYWGPDRNAYLDAYRKYTDNLMGLVQHPFVATTHAKVLFEATKFHPDIRTIIIDEDVSDNILMTCSISPYDLCLLDLDDEAEELVEKLKGLKNTPDAVMPLAEHRMAAVAISEAAAAAPDMLESDILKLRDADFVRYSAWSKDFKIISHKKLPKGFKYVVLSATPNTHAMKAQEGSTMTKSVTIKNHRAKITQYLRRSAPRHVFLDPGEKLYNCVRKMLVAGKYDSFISYKFVVEKFQQEFPALKTSWFGNCEGTNSLEKCKKCLIVGTPHPQWDYFRLWVEELGIPPHGSGPMQRVKTLTTDGRYQYVMPLPDNPYAQDLYKWSIRSELLQAAGRLRYLDNPAELHIFSNMPLDIVDTFDTVTDLYKMGDDGLDETDAALWN